LITLRQKINPFLESKKFLQLATLLTSGALLDPHFLFAEITKELEFTKSSFGDDFLWGVSTAAYQIEGAYKVDGKSESIWDHFTQKPRHIKDRTTGNSACDFYLQYNSDIDLSGRRRMLNGLVISKAI